MPVNDLIQIKHYVTKISILWRCFNRDQSRGGGTDLGLGRQQKFLRGCIFYFLRKCSDQQKGFLNIGWVGSCLPGSAAPGDHTYTISKINSNFLG